MQFMTLSRRVTETFSDAAFAPHIEAEAERARTLYAEGFIRQIWHRADIGGACLLVEADSDEAVRTTLATLPLVAAGMLEIVSVVPLKPYTGFGPRHPIAKTVASSIANELQTGAYNSENDRRNR